MPRALALWLMFARKQSHSRGNKESGRGRERGGHSYCPCRVANRKQTFYIWVRATFGSALRFIQLPKHEIAHIYITHTHTHTHTHSHSHTHTLTCTSIFYHNLSIARLINLFAKNIFTSFIRNKMPKTLPQPKIFDFIQLVIAFHFKLFAFGCFSVSILPIF